MDFYLKLIPKEEARRLRSIFYFFVIFVQTFVNFVFQENIDEPTAHCSTRIYFQESKT